MNRLFIQAVPISHLFNEISWLGIKALKIVDTIEIKTLPDPTWIVMDKTRIFHSGMGLVQSDFKESFTNTLPYLEEWNIDLYSCDFGPACEKYSSNHPISRLLSRDEIEDKMFESVEFIRKSYHNRLAVENYNYFNTGLYEHICEPDFINKMLTQLDLGLVLDLGHAAVTAFNLKIDMVDYLNALPLDRVVEIHLSKPFIPKHTNKQALDAHLSPGNREYDWLLNVIKFLPVSGPDIYVVIECYNDISNLIEQIDKTTKFFQKYSLKTRPSVTS
jgi:uncharacterized protein (UPF0276 family)